jgi:hypothetical protein
MKTIITMVLTLAFGLLLMVPVSVQAQDSSDQAAQINAIATAKSGTFKGEVVSCDAAANTCVVKTKSGNKTGDMRYAQYNGAFNAAKDLKPGAKISGQWKQIKGGKIFATSVKDE